MENNQNNAWIILLIGVIAVLMGYMLTLILPDNINLGLVFGLVIGIFAIAVIYFVDMGEL